MTETDHEAQDSGSFVADEVKWHRRHHFDLHAKNRGPIETEAAALLATNRNFIND